MSEVAHELEDNPAEFTGRHGPDGIEVSVKNAGFAIPEEDLEKLFMPFKRGAASRGGRGWVLASISQWRCKGS